ncbi:Uncharacterized protein PBTT_10437 [Plasmodiophora brassicae]
MLRLLSVVAAALLMMAHTHAMINPNALATSTSRATHAAVDIEAGGVDDNRSMPRAGMNSASERSYINTLRETLLDSSRPVNPMAALMRRNPEEFWNETDVLDRFGRGTPTDVVNGCTGALLQVSVYEFQANSFLAVCGYVITALVLPLLLSANLVHYANDERKSPLDRAILPVVAAVVLIWLTRFGIQVGTAFAAMSQFARQRRRLLTSAPKVTSCLLRVAPFVLTAGTTSAIAGQDIAVGAKFGTLYGTAMLAPHLWDTLCVPRDVQGRPLPRRRWWLNPLFWADTFMGSAFIWSTILAMFVSVPGYTNSVLATAAFMSAFGLGHVACIADKFPFPDAGPDPAGPANPPSN